MSRGSQHDVFLLHNGEGDWEANLPKAGRVSLILKFWLLYSYMPSVSLSRFLFMHPGEAATSFGQMNIYDNSSGLINILCSDT